MSSDGIGTLNQSPHGSCAKCGGGLLKRTVFTPRRGAAFQNGHGPKQWIYFSGCLFNEDTPAYMCEVCQEPVGLYIDPAQIVSGRGPTSEAK